MVDGQGRDRISLGSRIRRHVAVNSISQPQSESLRSDLVAAYAAAGARVLAWAAVSRLVFGGGAHVAEFALLALIRSTVGLLNYSGLGIAPALIHFIAKARNGNPRSELQQREAAQRVYAAGLQLAGGLAVAGLVVSVAYGLFFGRIHLVSSDLLQSASLTGLLMASGMVLRLMSDVPSAWLQSSGRFSLDNLLSATSEGLWVLLTGMLLPYTPSALEAAGLGFAGASLLLLLARRTVAGRDLMLRHLRTVADRSACVAILGFGSLITLSQLADFLYAPLNCILINRMLSPGDLAAYTLALQVDAALLLISAGVSAAMLPRAAALLARGRGGEVLRLYWLLSGLSLLALLAAAFLAWRLSPVWLPLWLGSDMPAGRYILPWVMVHTVIGGSSGVGRAVLIAAGRAGALGAATIAAGICNVALAYALLRYTTLGLRGVVIATIVVVSIRCVLWMPWYVQRTVNDSRQPWREPQGNHD
jgi:O-antigen/teichoic acid export membrane protein